MNKKIIISTLGGGVIGFLLGWLVFGILLADFYKDNSIQYVGLMKEPPIIGGIFIANLFMAWLLAYIFFTWTKSSTFGSGFVNSLIISIPLILSYDLFFLSTMNLFSVNLIIVDVIANGLVTSLMGASIAWIQGMGAKQTA